MIGRKRSAILVLAAMLVNGGLTMIPQAIAAGEQKVGSVDSMIDALAARLLNEPGDAEGWRMLGWSYFNTGRYADSVSAFKHALDLVPDNVDYKSSYAEALVQAAGGRVSPEAVTLFEQVRAAAPKDFRARFYLALVTEQAGKKDEALRQWQALQADAPADAGWLDDVRTHIAGLSRSDAPTVPETVTSDADQQNMVAGMVQRLEERLAASPHDAEGWSRLIRSRVVLNQQALAKAALQKAMAEFADDPVVRLDLATQALDLGLSLE